MVIQMTRTQYLVLCGAMIDRSKNADPPLNDFGKKLLADMLDGYQTQSNTVDLRE